MNAVAARIPDVSRGARPVPAERRRDLAEPCDVQGVAARLETAQWFAARVRGGAERRVVDQLDQRRVFGFTPCNDVWRRRNGADRHKTLFRYPALPGYVLFAIEGRLERWGFVRECPDVLGFLLSSGAPRRFRPWEVEALACLGDRAEEYHRHMDSREEFRAEPGDRLRIVRGPFTGVSAVLRQPLRKAVHGLVQVELLGGPFGGGVRAEARLRDLRREED